MTRVLSLSNASGRYRGKDTKADIKKRARRKKEGARRKKGKGKKKKRKLKAVGIVKGSEEREKNHLHYPL